MILKLNTVHQQESKLIWHRGAKTLGGTMMPGTIWKSGTGATTFSKLAPVPIFPMAPLVRDTV